MKKNQRVIPSKTKAARMFFLQFRFLCTLLLLLLFANLVFLPVRVCQAAGQRESIYLTRDLSSHHDQLQNLPLLELIFRNGEEFAVSVEVETQGYNKSTVWVDYFAAEGTRTRTQGGVTQIPIGKQNPAEWVTLQLNISDDLQWAQYEFSSVKKVSVRGSRFDLRKIRFSAIPSTSSASSASSTSSTSSTLSDSSASSVDEELLIDFLSQDGKTISELGWSSNNNRKCFQIVQDKDALGNSFSYLRAEGGASQSLSPSLATSPSLTASPSLISSWSGFGNIPGLGDLYSGTNTGSNTGWNSGTNSGWGLETDLGWGSLANYRYPRGYSPYPIMTPYSYMSPFSPFGLGIGGPFGMGYGLGGSPLLAMGMFGSPLTLGGGGYGGGLYGLGGGLYGGGLYGGL